MCFPARFTIYRTLRAAGKVSVTHISISSIGYIGFSVDLTLATDWGPAPATSEFATITELLLAVFAKEKGCFTCHWFIAQTFCGIVTYRFMIQRLFLMRRVNMFL